MVDEWCAVWIKNSDTQVDQPNPALMKAVDRIAAEVRKHPGLALEASRLVAEWAPELRHAGGCGGAGITITPEMAATFDGFLLKLLAQSEDPSLQRSITALRASAQLSDLAGRPLGEALKQVIGALQSSEPDDVGVALSPGQRGLAREGETVVIPAAAHLDGALGTRWRTDLALTATSHARALLTVALLPRDQENLLPEQLVLEIEGGRSLLLEDVLDSVFLFTGAAALRVTCSSGAVAVTSRTYNLEGELGSADARTFGQFLPALSEADAIVHGDQGRLLLLAHDPSLEQSQRTNLILVNGGEQAVDVETELFTSDGVSLGSVERHLRGWEYRQLDKVFEQVTSTAVEDGYAVVRVTSSGGRVYALASVVDNLTGDPVAVPALLRSPFEETTMFETQVIQAAARIGGLADTDWRTDLVLHGFTGISTTAVVELLPRDQENGGLPESKWLGIAQGQSLRYNDVLQSLFETDGAAAIRVTPYGGAVGVSSRTFNVLGEDNAAGYPAGATFGQYMGPVGYTRGFVFGEQAWIPHLSHDPTLQAGSRANLGLANNTTREIDLDVELYQGDGTLLGSFTTTLRQWENVLISRVFERVTNDAVESGYAIVTTTHPQGSFFAYCSVVDNRTGDPITVEAVAIRRGQAAGVVASGDMLMRTLESGFDLRTLFEALRAATLSTYMDGMAEGLPDRVTRTANGVIFDLGAGSVIGGNLFAAGRVGLEDASVSDGSTVSGTVSLSFEDMAVDGLEPVVDSLELGLDLARVGADHVVGRVGLASSRLAKTVPQIDGELDFDTRICEMYPIGGAVTYTVSGEVQILTFGDECDGSFDVDIPSARYYSLSLWTRDCQGEEPADPQVVHLIDDGGQLSVDPSSPPESTGRLRWAANGSLQHSEAAVRFMSRQGTPSSEERLVGGFQGQLQDTGGPVYYTGTYGYTVSEDVCQASYYHGRDDLDFSAGILQECDGPCAEQR